MSAKRLALIGMLGALGAILMMFRFPIPFMPPFLSFDLAAIPELIGAFALGPVAGVLIVFIRVMVQMVISGSNSMFTGELQSFLLGAAFCVIQIAYSNWWIKRFYYGPMEWLWRSLTWFQVVPLSRRKASLG